MNHSISNSSQFSLNNNNDNDSDDSSTATLMTAQSHLSSNSNSRSSTPTSNSNPYTTNSRTSSYSDNQIITTTTNNLLFGLNDEVDDEGDVDESSYYPPKPLKSTIPSKELEYELDSDELEESDRLSLEGGGSTNNRLSRGAEEGEGEEDEPLLMEGLLQSSIRRGSVDITRTNNNNVRPTEGEQLNRKGGASISSGIANMSNSILGAGIIGLPYATMSAGFFTGILLIVVLGMVTDWTIRLIVLNSKMSGRHSYIDIVDSCKLFLT